MDAFTIEVWWNFDRMRIIFKVTTGSSLFIKKLFQGETILRSLFYHDRPKGSWEVWEDSRSVPHSGCQIRWTVKFLQCHSLAQTSLTQTCQESFSLGFCGMKYLGTSFYTFGFQLELSNCDNIPQPSLTPPPPSPSHTHVCTHSANQPPVCGVSLTRYLWSPQRLWSSAPTALSPPPP